MGNDLEAEECQLWNRGMPVLGYRNAGEELTLTSKEENRCFIFTIHLRRASVSGVVGRMLPLDFLLGGPRGALNCDGENGGASVSVMTHSAMTSRAFLTYRMGQLLVVLKSSIFAPMEIAMV